MKLTIKTEPSGNRISRILLLLFCVVSSGACSVPPEPPLEDPPIEPKINDNVRILSDELVASSVVHDDRITFPPDRTTELHGVAPGDIIVSGYGLGFLRRVVSVSQSATGTIWETAATTLLDAIFDGDIRENIPIPVNEDFSGAELYKTSSGRIWIERGPVALNSVLRIDIRIRSGRLEKFEAIVEGDLASELQAAASFNGLTGFSVEVPLLSIPIRKIQTTVGPMPVILALKIKIRAGVAVELNGNLNVSLGAGVVSHNRAGVLRNDEGGWQSVAEHTKEVSFYGPNVSLDGRIRLGVSILTPIALELYTGVLSIANAAVELVPAAKVQFDGEVQTDPPPTASSWCTTFVPSLEARANLKLVLPGDNINWRYSKTLWETAYPFNNDETAECVIWDEAAWDEGVWQ